jgi:phage tail-like protein
MRTIGAKEIPANPAVSFLFSVTGRVSGGFSKISGIHEEVEVEDKRDGTDPRQVRKIVGQNSGGSLTLERGAMENLTDLVQWFNEVKAGTPGYRTDIMIKVQSPDGADVRTIIVRNCWPSAYELSDLEGKVSEVSIESVTLAFDSLEIEEA